MLRFLVELSALQRSAPMKAGRGEDASSVEESGISICKGHLRTLCAGILPKGDFVDGWADAQDGRVAHAGW